MQQPSYPCLCYVYRHYKIPPNTCHIHSLPIPRENYFVSVDIQRQSRCRVAIRYISDQNYPSAIVTFQNIEELFRRSAAAGAVTRRRGVVFWREVQGAVVEIRLETRHSAVLRVGRRDGWTLQNHDGHDDQG